MPPKSKKTSSKKKKRPMDESSSYAEGTLGELIEKGLVDEGTEVISYSEYPNYNEKNFPGMFLHFTNGDVNHPSGLGYIINGRDGSSCSCTGSFVSTCPVKGSSPAKNSWACNKGRSDFTMRVRVKAKTSTPPVDISRCLDRAILPDEMKKEIISVMKQGDNQKKLFEDWGLGEVIEYGRGMTFLFWGPPGTGKTLTAKLMATGLGMEMMSLGAAELQSSAPGEYERNVKKAFAEAKRKKALLFFDECDGMIQSRRGMGQIMSSEANCFLTELEKHEGVVVLATNRCDCLDEALERRISLVLEFKNPNFEQRKAIWGVHLPSKLPLAKDVDVNKLAEFNLAGGHIKNAVLNAARIAIAEEKNEVEIEHFKRAIERILEARKKFAEERTVAYAMPGNLIRR